MAGSVGGSSETSPRNYVLTQFAFSARGLDGESYVPVKNLETADAEYKQFVASRGQDTVIRIAKLVHDAPKRSDGQITDARVLGTTSGGTKQALEELLLASVNSRATTPTEGLADNPDYLAWAHYKVGATAVYALDRGFRNRRDFEERTLQSIDGSGATITKKWGDIEHPRSGNRADYIDVQNSQYSIPARVSISSSEEEGTETLRINGKVFTCRWQKRGNTITWTSDEVAGGLVMARGASGGSFVIQPQLANAGSLHSVGDIRFDIESISKDGPFYKQPTK